MTGSKRQSPGEPGSPGHEMLLMWDAGTGKESKSFVPPMDIYEKADSLVIEMELPGIRKQDIKVCASRHQVMVEGARRSPAPSSLPRDKRLSYLQMERKMGKFFREIELPVACNTRESTATYERGLLVIELKMVKERRGETINIPVR